MGACGGNDKKTSRSSIESGLLTGTKKEGTKITSVAFKTTCYATCKDGYEPSTAPGTGVGHLLAHKKTTPLTSPYVTKCTQKKTGDPGKMVMVDLVCQAQICVLPARLALGVVTTGTKTCEPKLYRTKSEGVVSCAAKCGNGYTEKKDLLVICGPKGSVLYQSGNKAVANPCTALTCKRPKTLGKGLEWDGKVLGELVGRVYEKMISVPYFSKIMGVRMVRKSGGEEVYRRPCSLAEGRRQFEQIFVPSDGLGTFPPFGLLAATTNRPNGPAGRS